MKKAMLVISVIVFLVAAFAFVKIGMPLIRLTQGDWGFYYIAVEEIPGLSVDVVRAEIISSTTDTVELAGDRGTYPITIYTIQILEAFQGELQVGDEIEMFQWGRRPIWSRNWISIRTGNDLILFLHTDSSPASIFAVYRLSRRVPSDVKLDASIRLNPVSSRRLPGDSLRITVEDLWNLRED